MGQPSWDVIFIGCSRSGMPKTAGLEGMTVDIWLGNCMCVCMHGLDGNRMECSSTNYPMTDGLVLLTGAVSLEVLLSPGTSMLGLG